MENETILTAYHESARVVFAYLNGFACDSMGLPGKGAKTNSKLNAGKDIALVQAVFAGDPLLLPTEDLQQAIEVAKKLLTVYCAGTCARIYFQNDLKIPDELEVNLSGQDLTMIEKIQAYLKKVIVDHPDDFPSETIALIFKKLKSPEVWKAIEGLSTKILQTETNALSRFYVEDTLMQAGIRPQKPTTKSGFSLGLQEDEDEEDETVRAPAPETKAAAYEATDVEPVDIIVKDFLKKIKRDWKEEELNAAMKYLHGVYKRYG